MHLHFVKVNICLLGVGQRSDVVKHESAQDVRFGVVSRKENYLLDLVLHLAEHIKGFGKD